LLRRYNFGTGKVNALGGFTGAVLLVVFALVMAWESLARIIHPVAIAFDQAILVAVVGLIVNGASVFILDHGPAERQPDHDTREGRGEGRPGHHHDHNLRSAYLHVLADALTSLLAIFALLTAKYLGLIWMDPVMGVLGAVLVSRWSLGLLRASGAVLLDKRESGAIQAEITARIENDGDTRVADLHLWSIGAGQHGLILTVVAHDPRPPAYYKQLLPSGLGLAHVTVEVHRCCDEDRHLPERSAAWGERTDRR
jgi:cation diffusion facilitator family transporter